MFSQDYPLQGEDVSINPARSGIMIRAAIVFFVLTLLAVLFGAYGIAGVSMEVGKILLMVFLALAVLSFVGSLVSGGRKPTH